MAFCDIVARTALEIHRVGVLVGEERALSLHYIHTIGQIFRSEI